LHIKGLLEKLDLDQATVDRLRRMRVRAAVQYALFANLIVARGGNIHRVNRKATAKRRARNKAARKQRARTA
jgi:hypothetical protein